VNNIDVPQIAGFCVVLVPRHSRTLVPLNTRTRAIEQSRRCDAGSERDGSRPDPDASVGLPSDWGEWLGCRLG
jgi:hypothetical protein